MNSPKLYATRVYPIISSMLMALFQGAQARGRKPTSNVDATIRRVAAGFWTEVGVAHGLVLAAEPESMLRWSVGDVECELSLVGEGAATFTLGRAIHARSLGGRLVVAPASLGRVVAARLTGSRVRTGDRELDESFVILAEPSAFADAVLRWSTRTCMRLWTC